MHKPQLRGYSILPRRACNQSPNCINWIVNDKIEIIKGSVGRTIENKLSRICKSELAKEYINLCRITNNLSSIVNKDQTSVYYDSLKYTNINYVAAKQALMLAFQLSNYGIWVKKPEELKTFEINV